MHWVVDLSAQLWSTVNHFVSRRSDSWRITPCFRPKCAAGPALSRSSQLRYCFAWSNFWIVSRWLSGRLPLQLIAGKKTRLLFRCCRGKKEARWSGLDYSLNLRPAPLGRPSCPRPHRRSAHVLEHQLSPEYAQYPHQALCRFWLRKRPFSQNGSAVARLFLWAQCCCQACTRWWCRCPQW